MQRLATVRFAVLVALALAARATANAEEFIWLQPETVSATPGATIYFEARLSGDFRGASRRMPLSRLDSSRLILAGQSLPLTTWVETADALRSLTTFPRPGIAMAEIRLKPEARSVSRADVERYLIALHASDEIRAAWDRIEAPSPWQEVRTILLKTFVCVGTRPAAESDWSESGSRGLDLIPIDNPIAVRRGDPFSVRVMRDGNALPGAVVEYLSDGESREHVCVTDRAGMASAVINQKGTWLIRAFDVRRVNASNHDWETGTVALLVVASQ